MNSREKATELVDEWDWNNRMALLRDHRDDLINCITTALQGRPTNSAAADKACAIVDQFYGVCDHDQPEQCWDCDRRHRTKQAIREALT